VRIWANRTITITFQKSPSLPPSLPPYLRHDVARRRRDGVQDAVDGVGALIAGHGRGVGEETFVGGQHFPRGKEGGREGGEGCKW